MTVAVDERMREQLVTLRRDLHRHPELSWREQRTADRVCERLEQLGIPYRRGIAGTGVIGDIPGPGSGPVVALRADMDALPIKEETGLEFASVNDGVMHACGHDGHTTMVLGAAELLARDGALPGPVRLIFQPAEEVAGGANAMIEAGALDAVAMIFGIHVDRHYPTGTIVAHEGAVNASSDAFRIEISGLGAHAARPHESVDAVVVGSLLVMAIQTIVSREVNPAHPSVVTVGRFAAGTASNVIAGQAVLEGTIRAQEPEVRQHLITALRRITQAVGQLHNAQVALHITDGTPAVINAGAVLSLAREAASQVVGEERVVPLHTANMGGEDFAYYLERVRGCFVRLGAQVVGRESFPAHSNKFDFDEGVLPIGAQYLYNVARVAGRRLASEGESR